MDNQQQALEVHANIVHSCSGNKATLQKLHSNIYHSIKTLNVCLCSSKAYCGENKKEQFRDLCYLLTSGEKKTLFKHKLVSKNTCELWYCFISDAHGRKGQRSAKWLILSEPWMSSVQGNPSSSWDIHVWTNDWPTLPSHMVTKVTVTQRTYPAQIDIIRINENATI